MRVLKTLAVSLLLISKTIAVPTPSEVKAAIIQVCHDQGFPAPIMLAICERESDFGRTLDEDLRGDHGHGRGHLQVDDRWHAKWLQTHNWRDPAVSCRYAIKLLRANLKRFGGHWQRAVAAYNCGCGNVPLTGSDWDRRTTGRNYSRDVFKRAYRLGLIYSTCQTSHPNASR